eukprot:m.173346 g.173346  ORF g.173346 m.173346 type:complete len:697 (+) comp15386_c0_seq12:157-2247(+)
MSSYQDEYYYEDSLGGGRAPSDDAENRSIKGGEFILQSRLGHGQFGAAWKTLDTKDESIKVVKQIYMGDSESTGAFAEAEVLRVLKHPNILAYHDAFVEDLFLYIVTEYCDGGDLGNVIAKTKERNEVIHKKIVLNWMVQLAMALAYLHERRVLHRDLKTGNIFLKKGLVKLGDFGIARVLQGTMDNATTFAGTPYYMSPEVLQSSGYNAKSDMWALGCVLVELCLLKQAFDGSSGLMGLMYQICQGDPPELPDMYGENLQNLCQRLLDRKPENRYSAKELLMLPFISEHIQDYKEEMISASQINREAKALQKVASRKKSVDEPVGSPPRRAARVPSRPRDRSPGSSLSSSKRSLSSQSHVSSQVMLSPPTQRKEQIHEEPEKPMSSRERLRLKKQKEAVCSLWYGVMLISLIDNHRTNVLLNCESLQGRKRKKIGNCIFDLSFFHTLQGKFYCRYQRDRERLHSPSKRDIDTNRSVNQSWRNDSMGARAAMGYTDTEGFPKSSVSDPMSRPAISASEDHFKWSLVSDGSLLDTHASRLDDGPKVSQSSREQSQYDFDERLPKSNLNSSFTVDDEVVLYSSDDDFSETNSEEEFLEYLGNAVKLSSDLDAEDTQPEADRKISSQMKVERNSRLRQEAIDKLGGQQFSEVYEFLSNARRGQMDEDRIQRTLRNLVGNDVEHCFLVDQLVYGEIIGGY